MKGRNTSHKNNLFCFAFILSSFDLLVIDLRNDFLTLGSCGFKIRQVTLHINHLFHPCYCGF